MEETAWQQDINRSSLAIARQNVGLTTAEATKRVIGRNPRGIDRVDLWESGQANPTYKQLDKLADIYNVNPMQLLLDDNLPATDQPSTFRSKKTVDSSYNLQRFISILRVRQDIIHNNLRRDGASKHPLVGKGKNYSDPSELADFIRQEIGYNPDEKPASQNALKHLRAKTQEQYIFVFKTMSTSRDVIEVDEMRGLYLHDGYAPFIAINRRDWVKSQLFSLAHELAHLFRADEKIDSIAFRDLNHINDPEETFCNQVASALLIPPSSLANQETWSLEGVKKLSRKHQASDLVGLYRLAEAGLIKPQDKQRFARQLNKEYQDYMAQKRPAKASGGNYNHNMHDSNGGLFNDFVLSLNQDGRISAVEAQNLLKMSLAEVEI